MRSEGFIYAIRCGEHVKLGWSLDPLRRLDSIATGNVLPCELVGFMGGTRAQESALHKLFSKWRVRGEWFEFSTDVAEFVRLMPHRPKREGLSVLEKLEEWQRLYCVDDASLSRKLACAPRTLRRLKNVSALPRRMTLERLREITRGLIDPVDCIQFFAERGVPT